MFKKIQDQWFQNRRSHIIAVSVFSYVLKEIKIWAFINNSLTQTSSYDCEFCIHLNSLKIVSSVFTWTLLRLWVLYSPELTLICCGVRNVHFRILWSVLLNIVCHVDIFLFGHCIVCHSSIYCFWSPIICIFFRNIHENTTSSFHDRISHISFVFLFKYLW